MATENLKELTQDTIIEFIIFICPLYSWPFLEYEDIERSIWEEQVKSLHEWEDDTIVLLKRLKHCQQVICEWFEAWSTLRHPLQVTKQRGTRLTNLQVGEKSHDIIFLDLKNDPNRVGRNALCQSEVLYDQSWLEILLLRRERERERERTGRF